MSPEPSTSPAAVRMATFRDAMDQLEEALRGTNEKKILAKINVAAAALYDVWSLLGVKSHQQVEWAGDDPERRNLVGLVFARGELTHQGQHAAMAAGLGEGRFGYGPFGGGWVWRDFESRPAFAASKTLYDEQVNGRSVLKPLRRALLFLEADERLNPQPIIKSPLAGLGGSFYDGGPLNAALARALPSTMPDSERS